MHPRVATLLPLYHLPRLLDDEYYMALAHSVEVNKRYAWFYSLQAAAGKHVILDNSAVELGHPMEFPRYIQLAANISATEIMLPDWYKDASKTLMSMRDALKYIEFRRSAGFNVGYHPRIMVIPQGTDIRDWERCACHMLEEP